MKAVIAITLALIFYTIGVWSEHRARILRPAHLVFFWLGLCADTTGTMMMSKLADGTGGGKCGSTDRNRGAEERKRGADRGTRRAEGRCSGADGAGGGKCGSAD